MLRPNIRNRTFDWMGEKYAPIIDPNHFLGRSSLDPTWGRGRPWVNIKKKGKIFEIELAVPGFTKKEIEVTIADDIFTVRGEREKLKEISDVEYVVHEFNRDFFERKFKLTNNIGHEKVNAKYKNGILTIEFIDVPKEEEMEYKKVEVV